MAEHVIVSIVNLISNNWDVFKYLFLALSVKYFGQGLFEIVKGLILILMSIKKIIL